MKTVPTYPLITTLEKAEGTLMLLAGVRNRVSESVAGNKMPATEVKAGILLFPNMVIATNVRIF